MCDWTGEPIEITSGVPKDVSKLRAGLIQLLQQGMKQGATPYTGPIAPQTNPLLLSGANMLMGLMGQGAYKQPGYYSMAGSPAGGGGVGVNWDRISEEGKIIVDKSIKPIPKNPDTPYTRWIAEGKKPLKTVDASMLKKKKRI